MKIKILGSAAAEGWPALFCECECCKIARQRMGKDLRRRTAYLLNDDILVDFGPDAYWQVIQFEIDLLKVGAIFYTHSHSDHCNPSNSSGIERLLASIRTRDIFGNQTTLNKSRIYSEFGNWETYGLCPHLAIPNKPISIKTTSSRRYSHNMRRIRNPIELHHSGRQGQDSPDRKRFRVVVRRNMEHHRPIQA